jgi:hypothetical protein
MSEAPIEKVNVVVNGIEICLDPMNMKYNENTLGEYMNKEYGWIDYIGKQIEYAQKEALIADIDYDAIYSLKFLESKDAGNSDNYAKAFASAHVDVVAAKKLVAEKKATVGHLRAHLKAWDKNHENAQNRSYNIRQEMKSLNREYYESPVEDSTCCAEDFAKK